MEQGEKCDGCLWHHTFTYRWREPPCSTCCRYVECQLDNWEPNTPPGGEVEEQKKQISRQNDKVTL